jgi:hypothetical protein
MWIPQRRSELKGGRHKAGSVVLPGLKESLSTPNEGNLVGGGWD